ncbi:MAG: UbiA family prenyltransferase [Saprospiraceae bacterium]|nr:UbiA family prenyltransferase [Saprospiraceae bacterium]
MDILSGLFRLIRPANVGIGILTLLILFFKVLAPHISPPVDSYYILILYIVLMCSIISAGNIINDYFDIEIDKINKPQKVIVGNFISAKQCIYAYNTFLIIGLLCTLLLYRITYDEGIIKFYIAVNFLLFTYSKIAKKMLLIGNIFIAFITAWSIMELFFLQTNFITVSDTFKSKLYIFLGYSGFSFLTMLSREIVKDSEDIEGDRTYNASTLPIIFGYKSSNYIVTFILISLLAAQYYFYTNIPTLFFLNNWMQLFIILPTFFIIYKLHRAHAKAHYTQISILLKILMLLGLLTLLLM